MILLDSSILIDFFRRTEKERTMYASLAASGERLGVSVLVEYELLVGARPVHLEFWNRLLAPMQRYEVTTDIVLLAVECYRSLKARNSLIPTIDLLIAATAVHHGLPLATLNRRHFERVDGLRLVKA